MYIKKKKLLKLLENSDQLNDFNVFDEINSFVLNCCMSNVKINLTLSEQ
jgi:hypothetical protein